MKYIPFTEVYKLGSSTSTVTVEDGIMTLKINDQLESFNLKNVLDIANLYHIAKNRVITLELNLDMNQQCSNSSEESVGHYNKINPYIKKWYRIKRQMKELLLSHNDFKNI